MINARMETVASSPAYRRLIPRGARRALQLADGYFEWLKPERRGEPRQPFHFQVDGGETAVAVLLLIVKAALVGVAPGLVAGGPGRFAPVLAGPVVTPGSASTPEGSRSGSVLHPSLSLLLYRPPPRTLLVL